MISGSDFLLKITKKNVAVWSRFSLIFGLYWLLLVEDFFLRICDAF